MIGAVLFALSSLYFYISSPSKLNSALLVSMTTLTSYVLMIQGEYAIGDLSEAHHWTRWAFYGLSCSLLAYEITRQLDFELPKQIKNIFLTALVMLTGVLSSVSVDQYKILFFVISCAAFGVFLYDIFSSKSKALKRIAPYIVLGWSGFPVVFLLSSEGLGILTGSISLAFYLLLDLYTKVFFYIQYYATGKSKSTKK